MFDITYLHFHSVVELGLCVEGAGFCCVDDQTFPFSCGDVQVIFPYQHHLSKSLPDQPSRWHWLYVDISSIMSSLGITDLHPVEELIEHRMARYGIFNMQQDPEVTSLVTEIFRSVYANNSDSVRRCAATFWLLLLTLAEQSEHLPKLTLRRNPRLHIIAPALKAIQRAVESGDSVPVAQLATECRLSEPHFRRVFRDVIGRSPHAYLQRCMLHKAERLLLTTNIPVSEISSQCGFEDISGFNRMFRQLHGQAPSVYRRSNVTR